MKASELIEFLGLNPDADVCVAVAKSKKERDGSFTESIRICGASSVTYDSNWGTFEIVGVESEVQE